MGPRSAERGKLPAKSIIAFVFCASMGPRSAERGKEANVQKTNQEKMLQWGHAQLSVESGNAVRDQQLEQQLQWGHAQLSVESSSRNFDLGLSPVASMGPRSAERGKIRPTRHAST